MKIIGADLRDTWLVVLLSLTWLVNQPVHAATSPEQLEAAMSVFPPPPWKPRPACNRYATKPIRLAIVCSIEDLEQGRKENGGYGSAPGRLYNFDDQIARRRELLEALDAKQISPADAKKVFSTIDQ